MLLLIESFNIFLKLLIFVIWCFYSMIFLILVGLYLVDVFIDWVVFVIFGCVCFC